MPRKIVRWLGLLLVAYMIYAGFLSLLQRKLIFPGTDIPAPEAPDLEAMGGERWWLDTDEGKVEAWFVPAEGANSEQSDSKQASPTVILAHGNGELIDGWMPQVRRYTQRGINVLLPEYRGYGRSAGTPSQAKITGDFVRFYDRLVARDDVDPERIAFHGFSLGGAVLASLAHERPPAAFLLTSTFTRVADMVAGLPVPSFLITEPFDTVGLVRTLEVPVLVIHGRADPVIPFEHGQRLAEAAPKAEFVAHEGGHHGMLDQRAYWKAVEGLFERAGLRER